MVEIQDHSGSLAVLSGLWSFLTDDTEGTLNAMLGGRIYTFEAPLNGALPHLVITIVAASTEYDYRHDYKDYFFQLDLYGLRESTTAAELGAINDQLITQLQHASFPVTGHDRGVARALDTGTFSIEDDAVRILTEWRVESSQQTG